MLLKSTAVAQVFAFMENDFVVLQLGLLENEGKKKNTIVAQ